MKRSDINHALRDALALARDHGFALPKWATWGPSDHRANPETSAFLTNRQIGWNVTDFGSGDFHRHGLTILSLRNGIFGDATERPYTEKLLFISENQETPFHAHKVKIEDIIARSGGNLMVEFTAEGSFGSHFAPRLDGALIDPFAGPIRLTPGESLTIPRGLMHRFWGEAGHGPVLAGEISQCNDDLRDNYFLRPLDRFVPGAQDEPALFPLWHEMSGA